MTAADDAILEFLHNDGDSIVATPRVIAANIDYGAGYVRERMSPLRDNGLVRYENEADAIYAITERGRRYLSGDLSAGDLEE